MSARSALRARLVTAAPSFGGRIYEPSTALPATTFPFLVIAASPEDAGEAWSSVAQPFQLWPYAPPVTPSSGPTPYNMLDNLVAEVRAALGDRDGYWFMDGGVPQVAHWMGGVGADFQDPAWQGAVTRPQRVEVASLVWLVLAHDVLAALRTWTAATLPSLVTGPGAQPPSDAQPWVFWRFVSLPVRSEPITFDYTWQVATVQAHVVAPTPTARMTAAAQLAQELGRAGASDPPTVAMPDGSWLQVRTVRADPNTDPRTQGQVQADVAFALGEDALLPPEQPIATATLTLEEADDTVPDNGPSISVTFPS